MHKYPNALAEQAAKRIWNVGIPERVDIVALGGIGWGFVEVVRRK